MTDTQKQWAQERNDLVRTMKELGYPEELGIEIAKTLGSPKAISRMTSYLRCVKSPSLEMIADEMFAIKSEVDTWRERKASQEANRKYNEILNYGLDDEQD